jgi:RNA polymerase sigma-70 factor (ECF subfamily)
MDVTTTDRAEAGAVLDIARLYERYGAMVLRRILRFFSRGEAQDVLQEVFVKAIEGAASFRADASPATWLYALTTNHCINRLRIGGRRRELLLLHGDEVRGPGSRGASQEAAVLLEQLWRELPDDLLAIAVHHYLDGMTHGEIARLLGLSRRTVGNRLAELAERAAKAAQPGRGG